MRLLIPLVLMLPLFAQPPQEGQRKGPPPPKNLKILTPEEVGPAMRAFTIALGVRCDYCHVQGDRASDENPKKNVARMMLGMVHDINAKFPDASEKAVVTCYTCHRGHTQPETAPPPAQ